MNVRWLNPSIKASAFLNWAAAELRPAIRGRAARYPSASGWSAASRLGSSEPSASSTG